jgi:hypothetical protein
MNMKYISVYESGTIIKIYYGDQDARGDYTNRQKFVFCHYCEGKLQKQ